MPTYYIRSSADNSGVHAPYPGHKYVAATASAAAAQYLIDHPTTQSNTKLLVIDEAWMSWFDVAAAPNISVPSAPPAYV